MITFRCDSNLKPSLNNLFKCDLKLKAHCLCAAWGLLGGREPGGYLQVGYINLWACINQYPLEPRNLGRVGLLNQTLGVLTKEM